MRFIYLILFISAFEVQAQSPSLAFAFNSGSKNADIARTISSDNLGNIYVAGYFSDTANFNPVGTATIPSVGSTDIFVAKYNSTGQYQWAISMGGVSADAAYGIASDPLGDIYIIGNFLGTADFDPSAATATLTSTGGTDIFIAKYNTNGIYQWALRVGSGGGDSGLGIGLDATGNIYTTGSFSGIADFDPSPSTYTLASFLDDIFVAKYTNNGLFVWANKMGGNNFESGNRIAVDGLGNHWIAGSFNGTVDFDPSPSIANLIPAGGFDGYVAKYNSNGQYQWSVGLGGTAGDISIDVSIDISGNAYVTGSFENTVDFDPSASVFTLTAGSVSDVFVAKYNPGGQLTWAFKLGTVSFSDYSNGLCSDIYGDLYVVGNFAGTCDFDPSAANATITATGGDIFIAKYNSGGQYLWAINIPGTIFEEGYEVVGDQLANGVYVTGQFMGVADFEPSVLTTTLTSKGNTDIFVAKYAGGASTGIKNQVYNENYSVKIYPNPSDKFFSIEVENETEITMYNSFGEVVLKGLIPIGKHHFDISDKPKGIYFVKTNANNCNKTIKLISE